MIIQCPQCRTRYNVDDKKISQEKHQVECKACSHVFLVTGESGDGTQDVVERTVSPGKNAAGIPPKVKSVLVVDDSKFFLEMIADILEPLHVNLLVATDGLEALDVMKKKSPDLVLLDLNLPKKNGFEVIREVRSNPALKDICLLAMSGVYHKEVDAAEAKKVGANDFIKKSFKPEELQQFVKMWLIW